MKQLLCILSLFMLFGCTETPKEVVADITPEKPKPTEKESPELKSIFDTRQLWGSTLILDVNNNEFIGYNFARADSLFLPASTYKIPNTIIGYETGVVRDTTIWRFKGKKMRLASWADDLDIQEAFKRSCVPCYQDIARKVGALKMNQYLESFEYGNNMDVRPENIDLFWLEGKSRINQRQQIAFLQDVYYDNLPISNTTSKNIKRIMVIDKKEDYILSGKTGWSIRDGFNVGWFVGFVEKGDNVYFFATNVTPFDQSKIQNFAVVRSEVTMEVFKALGILGEIN